MKNIFIRGIYSTALTKIFLDAGYNIVSPSEVIQKRFNIDLDQNLIIRDITIQDRKDKQGINLSLSTFNKSIENPQEFLDSLPLNQIQNPELIVLNSKYPLKSIYVGSVIRSYKDRGYSIIDLTSEKNNEDLSEDDGLYDYSPEYGTVNKYYEKNFRGVFQVEKEDSGKKPPILEPHYSISGNFLVLLPHGNGRLLFSKKIQNSEVKSKLFEIGKSFQLNDQGIIFRTTAKYAQEENLHDEIKILKDISESIQLNLKQKQSNGLIYQDMISRDFLFPKSFKIKLDEERRKVCKTVPLHHSYKSSINQEGRNLEVFLEYNEYLSQKMSENEEEINQSLSNFIYENYLQKDMIISIIHQKILGKAEFLSPGKIIEISSAPPYEITVKRKFSSKGRYDGLDLPIEKGDYALVDFKSGEWSYKNKYFNSNNDYKGGYYNINTPISIKPTEIHYFDLEIDVVEFSDGTKEVIDQDLFDTLYKNRIISQETYDRANQEVSNIMSQ